MQFVVRELKRLIELTAKTIGIPTPVWSVSEGTLIAALRWGGLWGEVRDYGLDLADDDLDFVLLLDNVTMFSKFSETFAQVCWHWSNLLSVLLSVYHLCVPPCVQCF